MTIRALFSILITASLWSGCLSQDTPSLPSESDHSELMPEIISAVDISYYPLISSLNHTFYDSSGDEVDFIQLLKDVGINTVRLRIWHDPSHSGSSLQEVADFSEKIKSEGLKLWLCPHYSDTWADPGAQDQPRAWDGLNYSELKDEFYRYTSDIVSDLNPDFVQIGNEINNGFLHPHGEISQNRTQFLELLDAGSKAIRENSGHARIIIHYAGLESSVDFYGELRSLDYDIAGISYYPLWHGKSIERVGDTLRELADQNNKDVMIAETAYPFTFEWNDWTNNIIGSEDQIIASLYPASPQGQLDFMSALKDEILSVERGVGFCYWGAEMISWDGPESNNGSVWENQAIFDFDNRMLPVADVFDVESP